MGERFRQQAAERLRQGAQTVEESAGAAAGRGVADGILDTVAPGVGRIPMIRGAVEAVGGALGRGGVMAMESVVDMVRGLQRPRSSQQDEQQT